ncbi:MAG: glycosyltransferase family 4 protein [Clostridia bacterium]
MHIWVMSNEYETSRIIGGLGVVATQLTHHLVEMGHQLTVLTNHDLAEVLVNECGPLRIIHFPTRSDYYCRHRRKNQYRPIVEWIDQQRLALPDLIHIHSVSFANLACYFRKTKGIPVVYTCHSLIGHESRVLTSFRRAHLIRQQRLLATCDQIVVPSRWQRRSLATEYPICKGKIVVIENGVKLRGEPGSKPQVRMLFAGRLTRQKGIEETLAALAILMKHNPAVQLDIAGTGTPNYHLRLRTLIKKWSLGRHVNLLGFVPPEKLSLLYSHYGAVIVPSKQESFGLVALEALANGVPLVSTRSGGLAQFVTSDVAQIIPRINGKGIAIAVRRMWGNPAVTQQRVLRGLSLAQDFEWKAIATRYAREFQKLCDSAGKGLLKQPTPEQEDKNDD